MMAAWSFIFFKRALGLSWAKVISQCRKNTLGEAGSDAKKEYWDWEDDSGSRNSSQSWEVSTEKYRSIYTMEI